MRTIFIIYTILHINSNQFKITAVTDYHTVLTPAPIYDIIKDICFLTTYVLLQMTVYRERAYGTNCYIGSSSTTYVPTKN